MSEDNSRNQIPPGRQEPVVDIETAGVGRLPRESNPAAGSLEEQKLAAEIATLQVGAIRGETERRRLELEIKKLEGDIRAGWLWRFGTQITALAAFLVAVGSIVTIFINWRLQLATREADQFAQLVRDFSSQSSSVRAGAVVQLGAIAREGEEQRQRSARAFLLAAAGVEPAFNVRHAIETALAELGPAILPDVQDRRSELEHETRIAFGRGARPTCESFDATLPQLHAMQEGVLTLAKVESRLTGC